MSDSQDQMNQHEGHYGSPPAKPCPDPNQAKGCTDPKDPPNPCPDPCQESVEYGYPKINVNCCPPGRECCHKGTKEEDCCTWDEVDACTRAASCSDGAWVTITSDCKCIDSKGEKCECKEWDCGCNPASGCVPCEPCKDLLPDPNGGSGDPGDPGGDGCEGKLAGQLNRLKKDLTAQQSEKAGLEAKIKAGQDREKELEKLITDFKVLTEKYASERQKLICREDCLKGFYRSAKEFFDNTFDKTCLQGMKKNINEILCLLEREKCCEQNLEGKIDKLTSLIAKQQQAEKDLKAAEDGFKNLKDFPKWAGDQFTTLEQLKDKISLAFTQKDPESQKFAFYLFYWKYVPGLCKRFPIAVCCDKPCDGNEAADKPSEKPIRIGCTRGDWHPRAVTVEILSALICCAAEVVQDRKTDLHILNDEIQTIKNNLVYLKKKIEGDEKTLDDSIKSALAKVVCKPKPTTSSEEEKHA